MPRLRPATICRLTAAPDPPAGDAQLLRAFLASRSDSAFAELVRRHGPMVFAVCRRVLGHTQDAEDAFQAAFLVLARKAGSVRGANLAGWLYGVAVRTARGVRTMRERRIKREHLANGRSHPAGEHAECLPGSPEHDELATILDEELARLPEHYRLPVVLCELRGRSRKEAAAELGIPEGTLSSRLAAAKRKLAERLTDRGYTTTAATLTAILAADAAARVPADWSLAATQAATGAIPSAVATCAADGVVKALFVAQLKGVVVAVAVLAGLACAGVGLTGGPQTVAKAATDPEPAPPPRPVADPQELVKRLGSDDFAAREDAAKQLRALGMKALPALEAGTRDPNPEVARRSRAVLTAVRADAVADLEKRFNANSTDDYDHPVWQRFKAIAGDSRASRELFAKIIANRKWLQTLDNAEADPARAGHIYRVGIAEMFRDFDKDPARSPAWPCDRPEEVAYLLLLGSHPDPNPPAKLTGDEVPPTVLRNTEFLGRGIIHGEGQILHARGLELGLEGKWLVWQTSPAVAGTDRVFARLLAAWLAQRPPSSEVVPAALRRGLMYRVPEILPTARRYAANDFDPKRVAPPLATITALELVAQLGTKADLPLFERHFGDETNVAAIDKARDDGARDYYRPVPVSDATQMRDVALGLALLLYGRSPEEFGFLVRKDTFQQKDGRYAIPWTTQLHLGFESEASRIAAHKKAKEWLATQTSPAKKDEKPPQVGAKFWPHFKAVAGDDKASRELFALIMSSRRTVELLEKAEANDPGLAKLYFARRDELQEACFGPADPNGMLPGRQVLRVPAEDIAGWLLLGTYPGTKVDDLRGVGHSFLIPNPGSSELFLKAMSKTSPVSQPTRKLFAAWLANRGDDVKAYYDGLPLALQYDVPEALPTARRVVRLYGQAQPGRRQWFDHANARVHALLIIGEYGSKDDLPLVESYFDDRTGGQGTVAGKDTNTVIMLQIRDVAVGVAIHLRGGSSGDFGFFGRGEWGPSWTYRVGPWALGGFATDAEREAAHKKAREWLAAQTTPAKKGATVWPYFRRVAGDDAAARELFDKIVGDPKNLELLEKAAAGNPELSKLYRARRDELNVVAQRDEGTLILVEQTAGLLLLGTFPGTKVDSTDAVPYHCLNPISQKLLTEALDAKAPLTKPLRKLIAAWQANRGDELIAHDAGLSLALRCHIPEVIVTARWLVEELKPAKGYDVRTARVAICRSLAVLVIGKYGRKDDLPLLRPLADDTTPVRENTVLKDGRKISCETRDVAVAMMLHLHGADLREFGFLWPTKVEGVPFADPFSPGQIGFQSKADRDDAHKKAKEWLDKQPKGPGEEPVRSFAAPAGVGAVAFDPKTGELFVGSANLAVQVWNPVTGGQIRTFRVGAEGSTGAFHGLEVSPDGKRIAVRYFLADPNGKFLVGFEGHVAEPTRTRFDRTGKRVVTCSFDGTARVWEADTGKLVQKLEPPKPATGPGQPGTGFGPPTGPGGETGPRPGSGFGPQPQPQPRGVWDAAFSPDGKRVVTGRADGMLQVWEVDTGKEVWGGRAGRSLMAVAFLPDGKRVVSGEEDGTIRIWDVAANREDGRLIGHTSAIAALTVTPDGKRLVSASYDKTVRVWDLESGQELRCFRGHTSWVYAVAVSPDGRTVASGGEDRTVRLWAMP